MNKSFLMVAQVFAIIAAAISGIAGITLLSLGDYGLEYIGGAGFFYIILATVDVIAAVRLNKARNDQASSSEVLGWSIYLLFFAGLIGGIFGILGSQGAGNEKSGSSSSYRSGSLEQRLKELDALYEKGLITQEEYLERRRKIITEL